MSWKLLRVALLPTLCLGFGGKALAQQKTETMIVIQDAELDNGTPHKLAVKCGQSVQVYQRFGGRLWVLVNGPANPRGMNWGSIDAGCALPLDKAVPHFTDVLKKDPKDVSAFLGRAAAELVLKQHDKVIADCGQVLQLDARSVPAFHLRARAWIGKEQFEKAIADLSAVLRLEPDRTDAYRLRGDMWQKQKKFDKAIEDYSRLLRLSPQECDAYFQRGLCRSEKKEFEKAIADFNEVISRQPEMGQAYRGRGLACLRLREYERAQDDFTDSIRLQDQEAANWCRMAWFSVFRGDLPRAISSFVEFRASYLRRADDYLDRAYCRDGLGDQDKALADMNEALWIDPNSVRGHQQRGAYWADRGQFVLAMADFDSALKLDAKFAVKHRALRGRCEAAMGQYDKAQADFDEALRLGPDEPLVCHMAAWFRATCPEAKYRNGKQAVLLATKACQSSDWRSGPGITPLAAAYAELGNFDEAVRWQKKALELSPPSSRKKMADRLALYESHKPYRAPVEK